MEFTVWALAIFLLLGSASADEPQPSSTPSPSAAPALKLDDFESPLPEGSPEGQTPPILLPEQNFLPPPPVLLSPGADGPVAISADTRPDPENESRFKEVKNTAMGSSRANYLLKEAKTALTGEARKNFMRAYYYTVCAQMRRIDPSLKLMIKSYENEEIQKLSEGSSHLAKATKTKGSKGAKETKGGHSKVTSATRVAANRRRHRDSRNW